jgi:tripartite motif-containing protein 2/3
VPRSLGSVYGGYVARCLRGGLRGVKQRVIDTPLTESRSNGVALSRDGGTLFVTDCRNHMVHVYDAHTGSRRRGVGGPLAGAGLPVFSCPHQGGVAADGFLFVAERDSNRVQVLTPDLARHGFVGVGQLVAPAGVCADADVVVVTEQGSEQRVSVFDRADGSLRARFGRRGAGDGELHAPHGVCFVAVDGVQCIAVAEYWNARVSVFTLAGDFVRHVGVGHLKNPQGVACSAANELLVADYDVSAILMFNDAGVLVDAVGRGWFTGVAVHADGTAMFAQDLGSQECVVFV